MSARPVIHYISLLPGSGKTLWAVDYILQNAKTKKSILLYVAPTNALLNQVLNREIGVRNQNTLNIPYNTSMRASKYPWFPKLTREVISDRYIATLVAAMLGNPEKAGTTTVLKAKPGDCLFITHKAFLALPMLHNRANIEVIFDEAGSLTISSTQIRLDVKSQTFFDEHITTTLLGTEGSTEFLRLRLRNDVDWDNRSTIELHPTFRKLINTLKSRRYVVYAMRNKRKNHVLFEVAAPNKIFSGFKRTVVMSAFFETTEMYHVLSKSNRLECIDHEIIEKYPKRYRKLLETYSKIVVHPITNSKVSGGKEVPLLSKSLLNFNVILSPKQYQLAHDFVNKWPKTLGKLVNGKNSLIPKVLAASLRRGPILLEDSSKFAKAFLSLYWSMSKAGPPILPLDFLLSQAVKILNSLSDTYASGVFDGDLKPLLVINKNIRIQNQGLLTNFHVIPAANQGMNCWAAHQSLVFLGAFNPSPHLARFFKHYIPKYNPALDWAGNAVLQGISRTSVRNPNSTNRVHLIVPDTCLANFVSKQLKGAPLVMPPKIALVADKGVPVKNRYQLYGNYVANYKSTRKNTPKSPPNLSHWASTVNLRYNALYNQRKRFVSRDAPPVELQPIEKEMAYLLKIRDEGEFFIREDYKYRDRIKPSTFAKYLLKNEHPSLPLRNNPDNE